MIRRFSILALLAVIAALFTVMKIQASLTADAATAAAAEIIAANNAAFSRAYVKGDARAVASLYSEDARLHPPGRVVEGREAIERFFTSGPKRKVLHHSLETESLEIRGDTAIETGVWKSTVKVGDGDPSTSSDRYLLVWQRKPDGRWLIEQDWWHRPDPPVTSVDAKPMTLERVEVRTLQSKVNDIGYTLYVALPHSYGTPGQRYPVVYTLDSDYSFLIARNIVDHLSEREHLREVIVVSIAYDGPSRYRLNRTRDYTPTFVPDGGYGPEYQKVSGGGPKFLDVIEKEIIPLVDRNYATLAGDRTLSGHSYGALFTVWTMLTKPGLFNRYIAVSPSLWYDDHLMMKIEEALAEKTRSLPARAYLCVGSREWSTNGSMITDLEQFVARLRSRNYEGLSVESLVMENETHNSVYPGGFSNGLRYVLEGR